MVVSRRPGTARRTGVWNTLPAKPKPTTPTLSMGGECTRMEDLCPCHSSSRCAAPHLWSRRRRIPRDPSDLDFAGEAEADTPLRGGGQGSVLATSRRQRRAQAVAAQYRPDRLALHGRALRPHTGSSGRENAETSGDLDAGPG